MRKIIYLSALLVALAVTTTSCQDKLEEENHSNLVQDFMRTPCRYGMTLNSVYAYMRSWYGSEEGYHAMTNVGTDEYKSNIASDNRTSAISRYDPQAFNTANEYPTRLWTQTYANFNTLNFLIEFADEVDLTTHYLTPEKRDQYLGEAKFLRACYYFQLVQHFGDVTVTTRFNTVPSTSAERHDMLLAYEVIFEDLKDAIELCLPGPYVSGFESGRATALTARHVLAQDYLTYAWVHDKDATNYLNNPHTKYYNPSVAQEYYKKAYDMAVELIEEAPRQGVNLMPTYASVFDEANDAPSSRNTEELFVARWDYDMDIVYGGQSTINHYYVGGYDTYVGERTVEYGRLYGWNNPNPYTYDVFTLRDVDTRYNSTFQKVWYCTRASGGEIVLTVGGQDVTFAWNTIAPGDTALYCPGYNMSLEEINELHNRSKNKFVIWAPEMYNGRGYHPTMMKYLDRTRNEANDGSDRPVIIYRLAETYLLAAEAAYKMNDLPNATKYINVIRERARDKENSVEGALDIQPSEVTLEYILEEWTRELLAEHCRWNDLARTGTLL
ncbi:MAG: RagB/SusD family nutrient uptake outer membrane protein [Bacteroides sp.]|nr:RagB/SusD family nutrient uptake outer membrane protein [Bacteroides sp.]